MTATTTAGTSSRPGGAEPVAAHLRYGAPGQLTGVRFTFGGGEDDWVEADGWTQAGYGAVFVAPDDTRWDFTAVSAVPGDRAAVTYHGWLIPAPPASAAAAEYLPDPVSQLRAAEDLIRDAHPAADPAWQFWHHLAGLLNDTAGIAEAMDGGNPPMTWTRWNRLVAIARGYLAAQPAGLS